MEPSSLRGRRLTVLVVLLAALAAMHFDLLGRVAYAVEKGKRQADMEALASVRQLSNVFRTVSATVKPAVVKVINRPKTEDVEVDAGAAETMPDMEGIPAPWRRFFEEHGPIARPPGSRRGQPRRQRGIGLGSGVIVDAEKGYILTNHHVIEGAGQIDVVLNDGRRKENAKVIGVDKLSDLAVIEIKPNRLHALPFGRSDEMEVGDYVIAVGNPFGLSGSVSAGIISAMNVSGTGLPGYQDFIQTDAAINPGNSGGPLVNIQGEIIAINRAIPTRTGVYNGFGFAIPSNLAKKVYERLITEGEVKRGYMGVSIRELEGGEGKSIFGRANDQGVLVTAIKRGGPAATGGLTEGDLLLTLDGVELTGTADLQNRVAFVRPDTTVTFGLQREGDMLDLAMKVGEAPQDFSPIGRLGEDWLDPGEQGLVEPATAEQERLGVTVKTVTPRSAKQYRLKEDAVGAVISAVKPGGEADTLGLRPGDLVTGVMIRGKQQRIDSAERFAEIVTDEALDEGVQLIVRTPRGGTRRLFLQFSD